MEVKNLGISVTVLLLCGFCHLQAAEALTPSGRVEIQKALTGLSEEDTVKSSAALVSAAGESSRKQTVYAVLQAADRVRPSALPAIVGAIAAKDSAMASAAAVEALRLQPDRAKEIVAAAVKGTPAYAGDIVESVLYFSPSRYTSVGEAALDAAPDQARGILQAVSLSVLELKPYIDNALSSNSGVSVATAKKLLRQPLTVSKESNKRPPIDMTGVQVAKGTSPYGTVVLSRPATFGQINSPSQVGGNNNPTFLPPPTFTPLPVPLPPTPIETGVPQTQQEPPGGRNYSAP